MCAWRPGRRANEWGVSGFLLAALAVQLVLRGLSDLGKFHLIRC